MLQWAVPKLRDHLSRNAAKAHPGQLFCLQRMLSFCLQFIHPASKRLVTFAVIHCSTTRCFGVNSPSDATLLDFYFEGSMKRLSGRSWKQPNDHRQKTTWESTLQFLHMVSGPRKMVEKGSLFSRCQSDSLFACLCFFWGDFAIQYSVLSSLSVQMPLARCDEFLTKKRLPKPRERKTNGIL